MITETGWLPELTTDRLPLLSGLSRKGGSRRSQSLFSSCTNSPDLLFLLVCLVAPHRIYSLFRFLCSLPIVPCHRSLATRNERSCFLSARRATAPRLHNSLEAKKRMQNRSALLLFFLPLVLFFSSERPMVKDHATYITRRLPPVRWNDRPRLEANRRRTRVLQRRTTTISSSYNIQTEWAHGSALAPFGTCNKLNQLPRHL